MEVSVHVLVHLPVRGLKSPRRKPDRIRSLRRPATISGGVPPADLVEVAAAQEPTGSTHGCIGVRRALSAVSPMLPGAHRVDQEKVNIMRIILIATLAIAPLLAKDNEPAKRLQEASAVFSEIMDTPDKGIPQELLENAHCIVIVPNLKTAAFFSLARSTVKGCSPVVTKVALAGLRREQFALKVAASASRSADRKPISLCW